MYEDIEPFEIRKHNDESMELHKAIEIILVQKFTLLTVFVISIKSLANQERKVGSKQRREAKALSTCVYRDEYTCTIVHHSCRPI